MLSSKVRVSGIANILYKKVKGQSIRLVADAPIFPTSTIIINQGAVKFTPGKEYLLTIAEIGKKSRKRKDKK